MKLSHSHGATQDGRVMVERSDRMWSTGKGNGKPLQYSCLENPMNSMKKHNDRILKGELPRSVGAQYATGGQWRNNSRKNETMEPKQKEYPVVDVTGDRSKVQPPRKPLICLPSQRTSLFWPFRINEIIYLLPLVSGSFHLACCF